MSNLVETSIPWIGQVPTDWDIKPLFSVATENKTKNKDRNENVLSLSYGRIIRRDLSKNFGLLPENFDGYQVVETGYIIIRSTDLQNDKKSLRVGLVKENGVITSAYIGLSPSNTVHPEYLFYYLNMCDLKKVFYSLGGGLRQSLRFEEFKRFPVIVPPIEEQKMLSRYLDKKTCQIDSLVEKIQKKIELLKEQRTSLINHYVTKGLDPNVEMKDSGVEWIGEIPKHWEVIKLSKLITSSQLGENYKTTNVENTITVLKMGNIGRGEIDVSKLEYLEDIEDLDSTKLLNEGDLLFNTRNSSELVGKVCLWDGTFPNTTFNSNILKITFSDKVSNKYMNYLFNSKSILDALRLTSKGTTNVSAIYFKDLSEIYFPIAPREEQVTIIKTLNNRLELIGNIIALEERRVRLFLEYRQSLISSVVTGKVRVTEDLL